jgi:hypothetical protein
VLPASGSAAYGQSAIDFYCSKGLMNKAGAVHNTAVLVATCSQQAHVLQLAHQKHLTAANKAKCNCRALPVGCVARFKH